MENKDGRDTTLELCNSSTSEHTSLKDRISTWPVNPVLTSKHPRSLSRSTNRHSIFATDAIPLHFLTYLLAREGVGSTLLFVAGDCFAAGGSLWCELGLAIPACQGSGWLSGQHHSPPFPVLFPAFNKTEKSRKP